MPNGSRRSMPPGFTLIELMVTVGVISILAVIAMPNLLSVINANRLQTQADELAATLQLARSEALRRNVRVSVCRTTNGTTCAGTSGRWNQWIVLDTQPRAGGEAGGVIASGSAKPPVQITGSTPAISFRPNGMVALQGSLVACIPTESVDENQRILNVLVGGSVNSTKDNGEGACP
jgi:type IV fimbrial biogenesis protein FimT